MSIMALIGGAASAGGAGPPPPADVTRNSQAEAAPTNTADLFEVTINLAAGTDRVLVVGAIVQDGGALWSSGTFDFGGANAAAMTERAEVVGVGTRIVGALYSYAIPNAVPTGNKVIRMVLSETAIGAILLAAVYNNVGSAVPSDSDTANTDFDPATITVPDVTVANDGDLIISFIGTDTDVFAITPAGTATLLDLGNTLGGGISALLGDDITGTAGALSTTWTRNAGAAGTHDAVIITAVFPRL